MKNLPPISPGQEKNFNPDGTHQESKETLQFIAGSFANTPFPYSLNDGWGRFGMLGVLGDMILDSLQGTHIMEIGTGESSIYLTELARRKKRRIFYCDAAFGKIYNPGTIKGYLMEDSVLLRQGARPFNAEEIQNSQGVAYCGTSDNFFQEMNSYFPQIGLAFIDGEHHYEFVKRDFENIFKLLAPNGYIFLHDTHPSHEELVLGDYCADAYKVRQELEKDPRVDCFTFNKLVAVNVGLTMVRKKPTGRAYFNE